MVTPLKKWMDASSETDGSLAEKVGVHRIQILRIRNGTSKPSPKLAARLEAVTAIPAWEFLRPQEAA